MDKRQRATPGGGRDDDVGANGKQEGIMQGRHGEL
jgi:hypothetical protein